VCASSLSVCHVCLSVLTLPHIYTLPTYAHTQTGKGLRQYPWHPTASPQDPWVWAHLCRAPKIQKKKDTTNSSAPPRVSPHHNRHTNNNNNNTNKTTTTTTTTTTAATERDTPTDTTDTPHRNNHNTATTANLRPHGVAAHCHQFPPKYSQKHTRQQQ